MERRCDELAALLEWSPGSRRTGWRGYAPVPQATPEAVERQYCCVWSCTREPVANRVTIREERTRLLLDVRACTEHYMRLYDPELLSRPPADVPVGPAVDLADVVESAREVLVAADNTYGNWRGWPRSVSPWARRIADALARLEYALVLAAASAPGAAAPVPPTEGDDRV